MIKSHACVHDHPHTLPQSEVVTLNAISKISNDIQLLSQNIIELIK